LDSTETTAAGPDAGPALVPRNDPRPPFRERRAFLTEIAIVVIGVLLALGAEQIVQWWNWQSEVKESRAAIAREISHNLSTRQRRHRQTACFTSRLDDLQRWHDSWVAGRPLKLVAPIAGHDSRTLQFDAWDVALTGQVAAHIDLDDRIRYAALYSFFRAFLEVQIREAAYWDQLQKFDGAGQLSPRDLMELQGLILNLRAINVGRAKNWPDYLRYSREFGIPFARDEWDPNAAPVCQPLFGEKTVR
jgi:hypothetical protein